jgi:hypothetical protein
MKRKNEKDHDARKAPGMKEKFDKLRKQRNASRPKQRWTGGESVKEGGYWTRTPAE